MSSIPQLPSLVIRTNSAFNRRGRTHRCIIRFGHNDVPIKVHRSVARLYPGSENLAWSLSPRHPVLLREFSGFGGIEDDEDEKGVDWNVELLVRFLQNMFKKITKKARKAVRYVLPLSIPSELVCFSVDGATMLAFLWLAKAFLKVICTVGSVVFINILLTRGLWYGIAYVKESGTDKLNVLGDELLWSRTRHAM